MTETLFVGIVAAISILELLDIGYDAVLAVHAACDESGKEERADALTIRSAERGLADTNQFIIT